MKSFTIIRRKNPVFEKCPSCFSTGTVYRSHSRNWKEKLVKRVTFLKMYKCRECGWRGYRSTAELSVRSIQAILFYAGIIIIIVLIVRLILSKIVS